MADPVDRDRQMEHVLRRMSPARPSSACVDAERLAAWSAGGLRRDQAALVERHLADCADCQAILAAFVESEPVMPANVPFWHRWRLQWLVPIAAASVAVFAWTLATRDAVDEVPAASTTVARAEPAEAPSFEAPAPALPAPRAVEAPPSAPPAQARSVQEDEARMRQAAHAAAQQASPVPPPSVALPAPMRDTTAADAVIAEKTEAPPSAPAPAAPAPAPQQTLAAAPPPPPPPAPAQAQAEASQARTASGQQAGVAVPAGTASAPVTAQSGERSFAVVGGRGQNNVMMDGISVLDATPPVHAQLDASEPVVFRAPASTPRVAETAQAARGEPPPLATTWRIGLDGRVLRSRDLGRTWSAVAIDPALFITAGSAPVDGVCWLVDRGGAVLRSTNGVDFQRTAFTAAATPVSVLAVDASQATVVTDDGRVFMTTSGGATWTRMP